MPQSKFLRHEPCDQCGSRDNVGVWSDGSKYCFGCHWWSGPNYQHKLEAIKQFHTQNRLNDEGEEVIELPVDYTMTIPLDPYKWVRQYLSQFEVEEHKIGWSEQMERLIFPVYDNQILKMWTGRYFGKDEKAPKYWTEGSRNSVVHLIHPQPYEKVVLVEDIVSAIKTARVMASCPLFGTKIPHDYAKTLGTRFRKAIVWLDPDKRKEAVKQAMELSNYFQQGISVIFSDKDPKCYETVDIYKKIGVIV